MSEINVTPFVDVMLVLLIVFMVTAPLLTVGIPIDLPKVKAKALTDQKDPIEITLKLDVSMTIKVKAASTLKGIPIKLNIPPLLISTVPIFKYLYDPDILLTTTQANVVPIMCLAPKEVSVNNNNGPKSALPPAPINVPKVEVIKLVNK